MKLRVTKGENPKKPWLVKDGDRVLDTFGTWDEAMSSLKPKPIPRGVVWGDSFLTEPVSNEVVKVLREVEREIVSLATVRLARYGLSPYDIAAPSYERIVREQDVPLFAALQRERRL